MKSSFVVFSFALLIASFALADAQKPSAEEIAALKAHNQNIVAQTPEAAGVFAVQDDGSVKHVQSGMVCAGRYPNMEFWHAEVFSSGADRGGDIGCDYGRNGSDGAPVAKLTVFAVRQADGLTVDKAFAGFRAQVVTMYPDATPSGPALEIKAGDSDKNTTGPFADFRSEEFVRVQNGQTWTEDLIVLINKGWVLEIRKTFRGKPTNVEITGKEGPHEIANAMGDRIMNIRVMMDTALTLGQ